MIIRDSEPRDFARILALNQAFVQFLSPLSARRLIDLNEIADYHRVAEIETQVTGFLLALREATDYDNPNYRWFAERYPEFLYIDRVVVDTGSRRDGIGRALYSDLMEHATRSGVQRIACEFNTDPPNRASQAFHERLGFAEVGTQQANGKRVSLQILEPIRHRNQ